MKSKPQRTVVFSDGRLIGESALLNAVFQGSIEVVSKDIWIRGKGSALVQLRNKARVDFELRLNPRLPEMDVLEKLMLPAGKVSLLRARCVSDRVTGEQEVFLPCKVQNLLVAPNKGLTTRLRVKVKYEPAN